MKKLLIVLLLLQVVSAKIIPRNSGYANYMKGHHKYEIPAHNFASDYDESVVASESTLRASFTLLSNVKYAQKAFRWLSSCFKTQTQKEYEEEIIEKELQAIAKNRHTDIFIQRVQYLQKRIGGIYNKLQSDLTFVPPVVFHEDGSLVVDGVEYSFTEVAFADDRGYLESIEGIVHDRLLLSLNKALV